MKPEELLIPRYKVIDDFPFNSYYKVGGIITDPGGLGAAINENGYPVIFCEWEDYPNIFKKLEWWEDREENDFPSFIKSKTTGKVLRAVFGREYKWDNILPATEEEFINQKNKS